MFIPCDDEKNIALATHLSHAGNFAVLKDRGGMMLVLPRSQQARYQPMMDSRADFVAKEFKKLGYDAEFTKIDKQPIVHVRGAIDEETIELIKRAASNYQENEIELTNQQRSDAAAEFIKAASQKRR